MNDFIREIDEKGFKNIYFLCSGGFDSTYMLLHLYNKFPECKKYIIYHNTTISIPKCKNLVYILSFLTGFPIIETKPKCNVKAILKIAFSNKTLMPGNLT